MYSTIFLTYDIFQLSLLFFLLEELQTHLYFNYNSRSFFVSIFKHINSSIILVILTVSSLSLLNFFHFELPNPDVLHFHTPKYYLYSIPIAIIIGLIFLVYFGLKFGKKIE